MPALPLDEAGKYVAAAYLVFLALVVIYVAIMAAKLARLERDLGELTEIADVAGEGPGGARPTGDPAGADAGADPQARAVGEGKVFQREQSIRQEEVP